MGFIRPDSRLRDGQPAGRGGPRIRGGGPSFVRRGHHPSGPGMGVREHKSPERDEPLVALTSGSETQSDVLPSPMRPAGNVTPPSSRGGNVLGMPAPKPRAEPVTPSNEM